MSKLDLNENFEYPNNRAFSKRVAIDIASLVTFSFIIAVGLIVGAVKLAEWILS